MATRWKYQKGKYKQISLKFSIDNEDDMLLYHFLQKYENKSELIKQLINDEMWKVAYNER